MDYLSQVEQEFQDNLLSEVDLEPNIVETDDFNFEDQVALFDEEDSDYDLPEDSFETLELESEDSGEYYFEDDRREKANRSRSLQNRGRSITNQKNIIKVNREVGRIKKRAFQNAKKLKRYTKRSRIYEVRNRKAHRKITTDMNRAKRAIRAVGLRSAQNAQVIEQMSLMAIPKFIGNALGPFASTDLGSALPAALAELTVLIPPSKKMNKWAMVSIATAAVAISTFLGDFLEGLRGGDNNDGNAG